MNVANAIGRSVEKKRRQYFGVRTVVLGLCIACSVLAYHGEDDEGSGRYPVQNFATPAFASGSSSSADVVVTTRTARLTLTTVAPTVIVSAASSSSST